MKWMPTIALFLCVLSFSGCRSEALDQALSEQPSQQSLIAATDADKTSLFPPHIEAELQRRLAKEVDGNRTPGVSMYVETSSGVWMGAKGKANQETGTLMQPTDRFRIGRLTNLFMAVVCLQLAEEGILNLDAPIADYLPEDVSDRIANRETIRIRQLLNHTSGLAEVYQAPFWEAVRIEPEHEWTTREVLTYAYEQEPATVQGAFSYASTNYLLLELILEKATGIPLAEILQQRIKSPAGLTNTFLELREPIPGGFAQGYQDWDLNGTPENVTTPLVNTGLGLGDRGLVSNATDLAKLFRILLHEDTLLYQGSLEDLLSPTPIGAVEGYGLGLTYHLTPWGEAWGQTSSALGFQSVVLYLPIHDLTLVAWMNTGDSDAIEPLKLAEDALRIILGEPLV
jgi:D-alanyl-D-alanine carboxypeptidase